MTRDTLLPVLQDFAACYFQDNCPEIKWRYLRDSTYAEAKIKRNKIYLDYALKKRGQSDMAKRLHLVKEEPLFFSLLHEIGHFKIYNGEIGRAVKEIHDAVEETRDMVSTLILNEDNRKAIFEMGEEIRKKFPDQTIKQNMGSLKQGVFYSICPPKEGESDEEWDARFDEVLYYLCHNSCKMEEDFCDEWAEREFLRFREDINSLINGGLNV